MTHSCTWYCQGNVHAELMHFGTAQHLGAEAVTIIARSLRHVGFQSLDVRRAPEGDRDICLCPYPHYQQEAWLVWGTFTATQGECHG